MCSTPERDRQLAAAVAEALKSLARQGVTRPDFGPRPQLAQPVAAPRLPPAG
jgi:hypothetical protein